MKHSKEIAIRNNSPDLSEVADRLPRVSRETKKTYKFAMNSFKNYCAKQGISPDLDSMLRWLESVDSPSTQSTYIAAVKKILGEVYKYDPRLPDLRASLDEIRPAKRDMAITESSYLTQKEVDSLIKSAPEKISVIVETLYMTGLRISELLRIKHENCTLIKRKGKKSYHEIKVLGKRNKVATVFISVKLFNKIENVFSGTNFLFEHEGKQYSREHITREIKRAGAEIGRPDIHAHSIRHSFAMKLVNDKKLSIDQVQRAMNHSSPATTISFYLHNKPTPEDLGVI